MFQPQHYGVWPAAVVVKTLCTFDGDFQSAVFLFESRADIVSWTKLFGAMLLPQYSDFRFVGRFEFFQKYFFSLRPPPLRAALGIFVGELCQKSINVFAVFRLRVVNVFTASSDTGTNVILLAFSRSKNWSRLRNRQTDRTALAALNTGLIGPTPLPVRKRYSR